FTAAGIDVAADAAQALRDLLGNDREITRRELEKLALHASESRRLTRDDVVALCADNAALVLDEVLDATGTGHAAKLELAVNRALAAAVSPQQLLGSAVQHFAALRRWRSEVDAGGSPREVLDRQRPRPHFSRKPALEQQLRLWPDEALAAAVERLQLATSDSRRRYAMPETVSRRAPPAAHIPRPAVRANGSGFRAARPPRGDRWPPPARDCRTIASRGPACRCPSRAALRPASAAARRAGSSPRPLAPIGRR